MEDAWTVDDGARIFRHNGWELRVEPSHPGTVTVFPPEEDERFDVRVDVNSHGITVFGEETDESETELAIDVHIPWRILQELCSLHASSKIK